MMNKQVNLSAGTFQIPRPKIVRPYQQTQVVKKRKKRAQAGSVIRFANETSLEPLAHFVRANSCIDKFIWFLLLIAACGTLGYYLYQTYLNYKDNPKVVSLNIVQKGELNLPNITVCIPDRMSKRRYLESFPNANFSNWNDTLFANYLMSAFRLGEFPPKPIDLIPAGPG